MSACLQACVSLTNNGNVSMCLLSEHCHIKESHGPSETQFCRCQFNWRTDSNGDDCSLLRHGLVYGVALRSRYLLIELHPGRHDSSIVAWPYCSHCGCNAETPFCTLTLTRACAERGMLSLPPGPPPLHKDKFPRQ
jgi:hypothetical protein